MDKKTCSICNNSKDFKDFYTTNGGRLEACCKSCHNAKYSSYKKLRESLRRYRKSSTYINHQKAYQSNYQKERKKIDCLFKLLCNLRSRHSKVLRGVQSTTQGLGCNGEFLRMYIQEQFKDGMSWSNYGHGIGKWNLDHKLPLDSCDRDEFGHWCSKSEYNNRLIHYTNLQPMWHSDNMIKSNKILNLA